MEIISAANTAVLAILKRFKKTDDCGRMIKYCVQTPVDGGALLFNLLTRELLLLTEAEAGELTENDYLKDHWFSVPQTCNEKELVELARWVLKSRKKQPTEITEYSIFTTTDCNARCFYCFEKGRSRIPMSQETAQEVVRYIKEHCGGKKVTLSWYGGEPLYNMPVIDTICAGLHREGIAYISTMISNGYLFNNTVVEKARTSWNLKQVQVALDGTEAVYNRSKAYIYQEGNPYQVVIANIQRLLDASIRVMIRLNVGRHNAEDLLTLVEDLGCCFEGRENFFVYAYRLFDKDQPMTEYFSPDEWETRDEAMCRLIEKITQCDLSARNGIAKSVKTYGCMADNDAAITILPTGDIGLCDHFSETEFIGHINREDFEENIIASWKETVPEIPECMDCFFYPSCIQLNKCPHRRKCDYQARWEYHEMTVRQMLNEYERWKAKQTAEEAEEDELC